MLFNTILGIVAYAVADGAPFESTRNTISGVIRGDKD